ncbi:MAG: hypothetical protein LBR86_08835 [Tannerella sp.]|nr:hypothetical protein [Tannerella sp.]
MKKHIRIVPGKVWLNGTAGFESASNGDVRAFLTEVYQWLGVDCRRFFRMDLLSKLGWLASEWLMAEFDPEQPREDTGIVFFNSCSSLDADRHFQETIRNPEACFPSPAEFVYTLPNIVAGEVAIRHRIHGETAFYILSRPDFRRMTAILYDTLVSTGLNYLLAGWLEACGDTLDARVMLLCSGENGECRMENGEWSDAKVFQLRCAAALAPLLGGEGGRRTDKAREQNARADYQ